MKESRPSSETDNRTVNNECDSSSPLIKVNYGMNSVGGNCKILIKMRHFQIHYEPKEFNAFFRCPYRGRKKRRKIVHTLFVAF